MKYVGNGFSFQMVKDIYGTLKSCELSEKDFCSQTEDAISIIGHPDLANIIGKDYNRQSICLQKGDILYVVQITGGRLPEGATKIPPNCKLKYIEIKYR